MLQGGHSLGRGGVAPHWLEQLSLVADETNRAGTVAEAGLVGSERGTVRAMEAEQGGLVIHVSSVKDKT